MRRKLIEKVVRLLCIACIKYSAAPAQIHLSNSIRSFKRYLPSPKSAAGKSTSNGNLSYLNSIALQEYPQPHGFGYSCAGGKSVVLFTYRFYRPPFSCVHPAGQLLSEA